MNEAPKQQSVKSSDTKKKDNTLKIVLIVVGALVGLMILGVIVTSIFIGSLFGNATKGIKVTGDEDSGSVTIKSNDGQSTTTYGNDASLPDGFPSDVPIYDPSTTVYATKTDDKHYSVALKTADATDKVLAFYSDELTKQGWTSTHESSYTGGNIILYKQGDRSLSLSVSTQENEEVEKTFVNLAITEKTTNN